MLATIKDYLLTVLVRAIIGYGFLTMIALVIFVGYVVFTDWTIAVDFVDRIANCTHASTWPPARINTWPVEKVKNILGAL